MEALGIYSLKAALILFLFWTIYQVFLRKETFYQFNRYFLLIGLSAALLLPLIKVHYPVVEISAPVTFNIPVTEETTVNLSPEESGVFGDKLLFFVYLSGICVSAMFGLFGLWNLGRVIRRQGYKIFPTFYLVDSSPYKDSFSFFRFIFLPQSLTNERERKIILNHEEAHIKQKHWVDLLVSNIFRILWWFNPVVWLYERSIRENHEFLADHAVLHEYSRTDYFSVLANQLFKYSFFPLTNSFNYPNQLKRIKMMKKNISNPIKKLSVLLLAPALAVFFWAFAEPEYRITEMPVEIPVELQVEVPSKISTEPSLEYPAENDSVKKSDDIIVIDAKHTPLKGKVENIRPGLNFRGTGDELPLIVVDGVALEENKTIDDINPDEIESITVLKDKSATETYGEAGKNGIILITTKKHQEEKGVLVSTVPITITSESNTDTVKVTTSRLILKQSDDTKGKPLFVVDGVPQDRSNTDIADLKAENMESIDVLKGARATELYGYAAKNGVVIITTKKGKKELKDVVPPVTVKYTSVNDTYTTCPEATSQGMVQGVVMDESNQPIVGATVIIDGSHTGTVTDTNGFFKLIMGSKKTLKIGYINYKNALIEVDPNQKDVVYTVQLEKD